MPWKGPFPLGQVKEGGGLPKGQELCTISLRLQKVKRMPGSYSFPLPPPGLWASVGGGLFVLGVWPAGGVVLDASQAEDLKGGDPPLQLSSWQQVH